jgi:hypothetical protein
VARQDSNPVPQIQAAGGRTYQLRKAQFFEVNLGAGSNDLSLKDAALDKVGDRFRMAVTLGQSAIVIYVDSEINAHCH